MDKSGMAADLMYIHGSHNWIQVHRNVLGRRAGFRHKSSEQEVLLLPTREGGRGVKFYIHTLQGMHKAGEDKVQVGESM